MPLHEWTKNIEDEKERENFFRLLRNSRSVLNRLGEILREKTAEWESTETAVTTYDQANWAFKQAHRNGQRSMIKHILKLINLDQEN